MLPIEGAARPGGQSARWRRSASSRSDCSWASSMPTRRPRRSMAIERTCSACDLKSIGRPEALRGAVGTIVADDDRRALLVGLRPPDRFEVDEPDLVSPHQACPSAAVGSQRVPSSAASHSAQASSYAAPSSDALSSRTALWSTADRDAKPSRSAYVSRNSTSSSGRLALTEAPLPTWCVTREPPPEPCAGARRFRRSGRGWPTRCVGRASL